MNMMSGSMPTDEDMKIYEDAEHAEVYDSVCSMFCDAIELYEALKGHENPEAVVGIMNILQRERDWYFKNEIHVDSTDSI